MSMALKKLNEVLENVSGEENIEISIIDDLRELSQFIATTGQCLILASSAKKCATFLQDNKATLAKYHCKTILFTPKEIPAKTLIKFTKVGLTESILESSPPKTFLYKVKLLLRSIKTATAESDVETSIKATDSSLFLDGDVDDSKEKMHLHHTEETLLNLEMPEKKKSNLTLDLIAADAPEQTKSKQLEENIDNNWKSDTKKDNLILEAADSDDEDSKKSENEDSDIDMYYRGTNKKSNDFLLDADTNDFEKLKKLQSELEIEKETKKNSYADVLDEGSMKQKHLDAEEEIDQENHKPKSFDIDLDLRSEEKAKKEEEDNKNEDHPSKNKNSYFELEKKKKDDEVADDDLGGYMKGKLTGELSMAVTPPDDEEDKLNYDNSELEKNRKNKELHLGLATNKDNDDKKTDDASPLNDTHDGEVVKLDGNMTGDSGHVEQLQTRMTSKLTTSANSLSDASDKEISFLKKTTPIEDSDNKDPSLKKLNAESENISASSYNKLEEEKDFMRAKSLADNLSPLDKEAKSKKEAQDLEAIKRKNALGLEQENKESGKKQADEEIDNNMHLRSLNNGLEFNKDPNHVHTGKVDKINTYYGRGEANKLEAADGLPKKTESADYSITRSRGPDTFQAKGPDKTYGEVTIDYRKLKEEFDQFSFKNNSKDTKEASLSTKETSKEYDDGQSKVIDIDSKSLDFSITLLNAIWDNELKSKKLFSMISDELITKYHCYPLFYSYKLSDKKFNEIFNPFLEINDERKMPASMKQWWHEFKNTAPLEHYQSKSMTTWRCPEIIKDNLPWEDVELPSWAAQELKSKHVELIFPYFDGIDRMGMAVIFFPEGVNPKTTNGPLIILEMARTLFLDTIERYKVQPLALEEKNSSEAPRVEEKKNVLSFFGGLFGKKKTG